MKISMKVFGICCYTFVLLSSFGEAAFGDKEDKSGEEANLETNGTRSQNDTTIETIGPPDSHEAMNDNRPTKPQITSSVREKRSYEFLIGLLNNNSKHEVTSTEPDGRGRGGKKTTDDSIRASEVLLELLVKIAAHPSQWEQVHDLLRKIDTDLTTSKNLYETINQNTNGEMDSMSNNNDVKQEVEEIIKRHRDYLKKENVETELELAMRRENADEIVKTNNTDTQVQKMIVILSGRNGKATNNATDDGDRKRTDGGNHDWPVFEDGDDNATATTDVTKYPWQARATATTMVATKNAYPRNFAYHRVTGKPFNKGKKPKAYIAVSVIAPKPIVSSRAKIDDVTLENELKELKPWTHRQNLKNMAAIRSRWLIQTDARKKEKENYAP